MDAAGLSRRQATLLALGAFVFAKPAIAARTSTKDATLPAGDCLLSRKLVRGLRDGNTITVTRGWRIEFARQSRGIAISGEQVSVTVEAPEKLSPIAKIERERSTKGLFPILLAPDGMIIAAGQNTAQSSVDETVRTAETLLSKQMGEADAAAKHARYLSNLQLAGSSLLDEMPGDLFYPSTETYREVRRVALPDGSTGEFEVSWEASAKAESGLLETARREVITRIGASERRSSEEWSLKGIG